MSSSAFHLSISIVIKTYDDSAARPGARGTLKDLLLPTLQAIERQTFRPHEVLIVDSSAGDGIAQVIQNYTSAGAVPVRRIPLAQEQFSYPRALNLGVQSARGDVVVSLSGDATPADDTWLERLVTPLADPQVAGAYGRQVARPGASLAWAERFRLWWRYRLRSTALRRADHLFSNACSAFRRELALRIPFNEALAELEDYEWAREVQRQGYAIAYAGNSEVCHSHASSSLKTVGRMIYYTYLRARIDAGLYSRWRRRI
jgi:GT2 family glycosyltransferase